MKAVLLSLISIMLMSCTTIGQKFDASYVDSFEPGITTMDEAISTLGEPTSRSQLTDGNTLLQWKYVQGSIIGGKADYVALIFDSTETFVGVKHQSRVR